jgi:hypothetical protein
MLSFLEVSPSDRAALLAQRAEAEALAVVEDPPAAEPPMGVSPEPERPAPEPPEAKPLPEPDLIPSTGGKPVGQLPPDVVPYMDVEGRGKRPLRFCRTVQDGHTASEQLAYQALANHARRYGRAENTGSTLVDIGLSQLCSLLATDHKNVKRLIGSLRDKLAIEIVRQPDYRLAIPTRYRVFTEPEILERRRKAGLVWVIRTRTTRFVDLETVNRLATGEPPTGYSPDKPLGHQPMGVMPTVLARQLNEWIAIDDDAVQELWNACRRGLPDCTEEEVHWFCRSKEPLIRSGGIEHPVQLLIRSVPQFFANGGSAALLDYRKDQARAQERERKRQRQVAMMILDDTESTDVETAWARDILGAL